MSKVKLGGTDLMTTPIVFGGNVFGWTLNEQQSFDMLDQVLEIGIDTIDTADVYSRWVPGNQGGESEAIIGKWMKDRGTRDKVNIITKVGMDMGNGPDTSAKHIIQSVEDSLRRLQTDHIDLYLTHRHDDKTPVAETLEAYDKLISAGKVRFIGASNLSADKLAESLEVSASNGLASYQVFQPEYNLYAREGFEKSGIAELCSDHDLGVITYFSLASGFLTGKYGSKADAEGAQRAGMVGKYFDDRGFRILDALKQLADAHSVSQAAVALAWLINKPVVTAPIASATKTHHLTAFTEALGLQLTDADMLLLDQASAYETAEQA